jgi:hypothetical protein
MILLEVLARHLLILFVRHTLHILCTSLITLQSIKTTVPDMPYWALLPPCNSYSTAVSNGYTGYFPRGKNLKLLWGPSL